MMNGQVRAPLVELHLQRLLPVESTVSQIAAVDQPFAARQHFTDYTSSVYWTGI